MWHLSHSLPGPICSQKKEWGKKTPSMFYKLVSTTSELTYNLLVFSAVVAGESISSSQKSNLIKPSVISLPNDL